MGGGGGDLLYPIAVKPVLKIKALLTNSSPHPDGRPKNVTRNLIPDGISQENLAEGRTPIQERYDKLPYKLENQYKGQKGQAKKVAESTSMGNDFGQDIEVIEDRMAEAVSHSSSGGSQSKRMKVYEATVSLPRPPDQVSSGLGSGRQPQDSIPGKIWGLATNK